MLKKILVVIMALALVAVFFELGRIVVTGMYYQAYHGDEIKEHYGFEYDTPLIGPNGGKEEYLLITAVVEGGRFHKAGIRAGDIVWDLRVTEFMSELHKAKEGERAITLRLVTPPSGESPRSEAAIERTVGSD